MPGIFEDYLRGQNPASLHRHTIDDHRGFVRKIFQRRFDGMLFSIFLQNAIKASEAVLTKAGAANGHDSKAFGTLSGGKKIREDFIKAVEDEIQRAILHLDPPETTAAAISDYDDLIADGKVFLRNPRLADHLTETARKKVAAIYDYGDTYGGHGPTTALGSGVLHAHANNDDGIAFKWGTGVLEIVAYGTKSDSASPGNSGYAWTTG